MGAWTPLCGLCHWLLGSPTRVDHSEPRRCGAARGVRSLSCAAPKQPQHGSPTTLEVCADVRASAESADEAGWPGR
eukprot:3803288-Alexandrium_andersonii.AAC.1